MTHNTRQQSERVSVDVNAAGGMPDGGGATRGGLGGKSARNPHDHPVASAHVSGIESDSAQIIKN